MQLVGLKNLNKGAFAQGNQKGVQGQEEIPTENKSNS